MANRYEVPGLIGVYEVAEYGWPPMRGPRRYETDSAWREQDPRIVVMQKVGEADIEFGIGLDRLVGLEPL